MVYKYNNNNQGIWLTDTDGNIRQKIGETKSDNNGEFIQAAGICFDSEGL